MFERFLNFERKEMPDIDMDFQDDRRDEVLRYVIDRYGSDRVAQIITFGTMGPKGGATRCWPRVGMSYGDVDRVARMVPNRSRTLSRCTGRQPGVEANLRKRPRDAESGGQCAGPGGHRPPR